MDSLVKYDVDSDRAIAVIAMNRPEKLNALNTELVTEFKIALDRATHDQGVRAVVIRGEGRVFSAGRDTADIANIAREVEGTTQRTDRGPDLPMELHHFTKPTVAAMQGVALGLGFDVALACDFRIAESSCRMGDWRILHGLMPAAGMVITYLTQ